MHFSPAIWFGAIVAAALVGWRVIHHQLAKTARHDPDRLRTFVTFDAMRADAPDPGSVLFSRILAALPKEIVVPSGQSTAIAHTGYASVGVRIGDWKADIFLGETEVETNLWTLFVEPQSLIDTPELRTLLKALDRAIASIPETNQVEWYKREAPSLIAMSPIDE